MRYSACLVATIAVALVSAKPINQNPGLGNDAVAATDSAGPAGETGVPGDETAVAAFLQSLTDAGENGYENGDGDNFSDGATPTSSSAFGDDGPPSFVETPVPTTSSGVENGLPVFDTAVTTMDVGTVEPVRLNGGLASVTDFVSSDPTSLPTPLPDSDYYGTYAIPTGSDTVTATDEVTTATDAPKFGFQAEGGDDNSGETGSDASSSTGDGDSSDGLDITSGGDSIDTADPSDGDDSSNGGDSSYGGDSTEGAQDYGLSGPTDGGSNTGGHYPKPYPPYQNIDVKILNFALTLEYLERKFYQEGLANYTLADFESAAQENSDVGNNVQHFLNNLQEIYFDEQTHVQVLSSLLGPLAVKECTYSFPSTDVKSFIALASVLEGVGVSAYLGAAAYVQNKTYLTGAASILAVEARHSSFLRSALHELPFAFPFDTPLDYDEVYTLASQFIVSCPASNANKPQLDFKAFPELSLSPAFKYRIKSGDWIVLNTPGYILKPHKSESGLLYAAFISIDGPIFTTAYPTHAFGGGFRVQVPPGVNGQSYVIITQCDEAPLEDSSIAAGPAIVEVTNNDTYEKFANTPSNPTV